MLFAHGLSAELFYTMVAGLWMLNLGLLLPGWLARHRYVVALCVTLVATLFAGWFSWTTFQDVADDGSSLDQFGLIVGALFGILFVGGCLGLVRWIRLPKP